METIPYPAGTAIQLPSWYLKENMILYCYLFTSYVINKKAIQFWITDCRNYFFMFLKWSIPVAYAIQISMCRLRKALGRKCILNAIPVENSLLLVKAVVWICKGWRNSQTLPP